MSEQNTGAIAAERAQMRRLDAAQITNTTPLLTRLLVRLFARRFNSVACRVILRARERGIINSMQMHYLCAQFDPTQSGVVGQLRGHSR